MAAHLFFDPPRFLRRGIQNDPAIFSTAADRIKCLCAGFTAPHPDKKALRRYAEGFLKKLG
jgi:hypothetical protein